MSLYGCKGSKRASERERERPCRLHLNFTPTRLLSSCQIWEGFRSLSCPQGQNALFYFFFVYFLHLFLLKLLSSSYWTVFFYPLAEVTPVHCTMFDVQCPSAPNPSPSLMTADIAPWGAQGRWLLQRSDRLGPNRRSRQIWTFQILRLRSTLMCNDIRAKRDLRCFSTFLSSSVELLNRSVSR